MQQRIRQLRRSVCAAGLIACALLVVTALTQAGRRDKIGMLTGTLLRFAHGDRLAQIHKQPARAMGAGA